MFCLHTCQKPGKTLPFSSYGHRAEKCLKIIHNGATLLCPFSPMICHLSLHQQLFHAHDGYEFRPISLTATLTGASIPTCYAQAFKDLPGVKAIGCKWVYSMELNSDGTINWYKARLVTLGNKQKGMVWIMMRRLHPFSRLVTHPNVCEERISSWRLGIRYLHDSFYWVRHAQAQTFSICLQQTPRAWFDKFQTTFSVFYLLNNQFDSSLFIHGMPASIFLLVIYVDDMVIIGFDHVAIQRINTCTGDLISLADLASATLWILLLRLMSNIIVMRVIYYLILYYIVENLNNLTITRPDIAFAVQQVSQFMHTSPSLFGFCSPPHLLLDRHFLLGSPSLVGIADWIGLSQYKGINQSLSSTEFEYRNMFALKSFGFIDFWLSLASLKLQPHHSTSELSFYSKSIGQLSYISSLCYIATLPSRYLESGPRLYHDLNLRIRSVFRIGFVSYYPQNQVKFLSTKNNGQHVFARACARFITPFIQTPYFDHMEKHAAFKRSDVHERRGFLFSSSSHHGHG
ncbi:hypothetical protein CR513_19703, partial [Mucuna pruriens]